MVCSLDTVGCEEEVSAQQPMATPRKSFAVREAARIEDWMRRMRGEGCPSSPSGSSDSGRSDTTECVYKFVLERESPSRLLCQKQDCAEKAVAGDMRRGQAAGTLRSKSYVAEVVGTPTRLQSWRAERGRRQNHSQARKCMSGKDGHDAMRGGSAEHVAEQLQDSPHARRSQHHLARLSEIHSAIMDQEHTCNVVEDIRQCLEHKGKVADKRFVCKLRNEVLDHRRIWADAAADKVAKVEILLKKSVTH